ncbi:RidA family protein [Cognatiyoonia sp. IB215446]|uniref:RidA family protein n=1 Tax=Cognatiyoonia sp. IB215446 TaxID=3097355 RepID=UPI002A155CD4|nr:RidA family protein [Cognatiyoonia sp. IB215446]MDX8348793.1 RidA family protein [Cognatiyoonia sp. IB215446]
MPMITRKHTSARMSQLVIHNGVAYLAGQVGIPAASVTDQTNDILSKIDTLLAEAGTDKSNLLTAQIWLSDIGTQFAEMNTAWDAWVPEGHAPARWTGEAKLATPDYYVEIIVTAAI